MIARHSTQSTDKYVSISESSISSPAPQRDSCSCHPLGKSILAGHRFAHCSALDRLYAPKLTFFEVRMSSWVHFAICVWAWRVHLERSLRQTWKQAPIVTNAQCLSSSFHLGSMTWCKPFANVPRSRPSFGAFSSKPSIYGPKTIMSFYAHFWNAGRHQSHQGGGMGKPKKPEHREKSAPGGKDSKCEFKWISPPPHSLFWSAFQCCESKQVEHVELPEE